MLREINFFGISLYPYSICLILGGALSFLLFMFISFKRHKQETNENLVALQMFVIVAFAALPSAIVFDSLFKMIESGTFELKGATFYGGLISAFILFPLLLLFIKNRKVSIYERLCDLATCIPAGHCLGRIGCFLGGCCFGKPTDCLFGVSFPENSLPYEYYGGAVTVHPTQLYEAVFLMCLFFFLLLLCKKDSFPLYFILYGAGRIFIEFFRNDDRGATGLPLSPAQLISVILILTGGIIMAIRHNLKRNSS